MSIDLGEYGAQVEEASNRQTIVSNRIRAPHIFRIDYHE